MVCRRKGCCFLLPLDRGCLIISLILLFFEAIAPPLRDPGSQLSLGGILAAAYRILNLIHTLGCLVLFLASFTRYSGLVMVFLCTIVLHIVVLPIFLFLDIYFWHTDIVDTSIGFAGEILSIYFSVMAYLFYRECKNAVIMRHKGSISFGADYP